METGSINTQHLINDLHLQYANATKGLRIRNDAFDRRAKTCNKQKAEKPPFKMKDARNETENMVSKIKKFGIFLLAAFFTASIYAQQYSYNGLDNDIDNLYCLSNAKSRSISPENYTDKKGKGDKIENTADMFADSTGSFRKSIEFLATTYGERYPQAESFLQRLNKNPSQSDFEKLRLDALSAHPVLRENKLIFVVRQQYAEDHHNTGTDFLLGEVSAKKFRSGGAIRMLDLSKPIDDPKRLTTLLDLPQGVARDLEVHFEGNRILFAVRRSYDENFHIAEMFLNEKHTGELRFLGVDPSAADLDPIYLPDGQIVFSSTRDLKYCGCNRHAQANLFRMNADGSGVCQIGRNTLYESRSSLLPDGRILYDRWEYVDRHFGPSFGLWTMYPDGRAPSLFYGNNAWSPGAIFDARFMPNADGKAEQVVCTFGACHDRPWGAIVILDRSLGLDGMEPVLHSWPSDIAPYMRNAQNYRNGRDVYHPVGGQIDQFKGLRVKYEDPFPLDEAFLLCARTLGDGERTGIFLIDIFGNEILLHEEQGKGCFDPMPLISRKRPPILPDVIDTTKTTGIFFVADVYQGSGMETVQRGTIKTLRVIEAPPKRFWTKPMWEGDTFQRPAMNFNNTNNKRILGDVPVEQDGSAFFEVPADRFVFFQALDAEGMMVQSMRSGTSLRPGETLSCIGCHESRHETPKLSKSSYPDALKRPPSRLKNWYGTERNFDYQTEVQPIWDKYCISCHDFGKKAERSLNLSGDLGLVFNLSYMELRRRTSLRWYPEPPETHPKELIKPVDDGPPEVLPPYAWGAHRSRLIGFLRGEHHGVRLDKESFDRIVTWIDINTPFYADYETDFPNHLFGRSPLDDTELKQIAELTGVPVNSTLLFAENTGTRINFTRPEQSDCLKKLPENDPRYQEAITIIRRGRDRLIYQNQIQRTSVCYETFLDK